MSINIDMGNIEEVQPLAAGGPYTLAYRKVEMGRNQADDADLIYTEIVVVGGKDSFIQKWSLKPGALSSRSSGISLKKFFEVVGRPDLANLHITDETVGELLNEMRQITFVATVKHETWQGDTRAKIDTVLEAA